MQPPVHFFNQATPSGVMVFNLNARPLFERARLRANVLRIIGALLRQPRTLKLYDGRYAITPGSDIVAVPIRQITGTLSTACDFDRDFYPRSNEVESRWVRIASIILQGNVLPPVELIHKGRAFYVIDGHHRISVSRMLGHSHVDALVHSADE